MRIVFFTPIEEVKPFVAELNADNGRVCDAWTIVGFPVPRIGDSVVLNVRENVSFVL